MYQDHFKLGDRPFAITPDPRYLFLSERHREALAHLLYGVTESGGFIQLTGEVGTGKTTLTRTLLSQLPANVDAALVYNPRITLVEFLETICDELGVVRAPGPPTPKALTDALNRHLLAAHQRGRRTVLVVDEAQNLDTELLEQVRLLTNLETHREKLLQILLIGQPELRDTLARNDLRQLAQRVTARYHLEPLDAYETVAYVRHRLEVAGAREDLFTTGALRAVHRFSGGIPRLVNIVCDRALLGAFADGARRVDTGMVRRAAREVSGELVAPRTRGFAWAAVAALVATVAVGIVWLETHLPPGPPEMVVVKRPVVAPAASDTDITGLESLLALDDDLAASTAELLARWNIDEPSVTPATLCAKAIEHGLACSRGRGTWNNLRVLDRPALLELRSDGRTRTVLLTGLDRRTARVHVGGSEHAVPLLALDEAWLGDYLVLWRPPAGAAEPMRVGSRGTGVAWVRAALDRWSGAAARPVADAEMFDAALAERVRAFQAALGLEVDGIAGDETLVHLDGLAASAGPRLTHGDDSDVLDS